MIRHHFGAMGTWFVVRTEEDPRAVERFVDSCEQRFSRFLESSELSRINTGRSSRPSDTMVDILTKADTLRSSTNGLVDIGIGQAIVGWGYDRSFSEGLGDVAPPRAFARPSWAIDDGVLALSDHTTLDLGGVAKGWTVDRLVDDGRAVLASAGGDLRSADPDLIVDIEAGQNEIEVVVGVGALATSSTLRRTWTAGGRMVNHLIDPRTMEPVRSPIVSATAITKTAVEAEAAAKAVLLLGTDGLSWAARQTWIRQAIVVWHDGSVFATKQRVAA